MVARAGGNWPVAGGWEAGDASQAMVVSGATEDFCQLDPKDRHPQWEAALGIQPGGRQTPPALCSPGDWQLHQYSPEYGWTPPALCDS